MADQVKILVVERNGVDLEDSEELNLTASAVPFTSVNYTATDVAAALEEVFAASDDFLTCTDEVLDTESYTIPLRKQMRVFQALSLSGELTVNGTLAIEF